MITNFEDFCLYMYVIVDDIWQQIAPLFSRPGPQPLCSDSEVITIALVSECKGWDKESELLDHWTPYLHLFPHFPERSCFNRRRRNLMFAINLIRQIVLKQLELSGDEYCVIDSLPIPVVAFHLVPSSPGDWHGHGAAFGKVASKNKPFSATNCISWLPWRVSFWTSNWPPPMLPIWLWALNCWNSIRTARSWLTKPIAMPKSRRSCYGRMASASWPYAAIIRKSHYLRP